MRRAAISIAANIAEGAARRSRQEYLQFLSIARGSLSELSNYVHVSKRLGYLSDAQCQRLVAACDEAARTLYGLMQAVSREGKGMVVSSDPV